MLLLNELAARGHATTLYLFAREGAYFDALDPRVRLVVGQSGRVARLASLARFLARDRQGAVVSFLSHFTTYAAVRAARTDTPFVISQQTPLSAFLDDHDYQWRQPHRRRLFTVTARLVYSRADAIAATSRGVADDLVANFGARQQQVTVLPNPVDIDAVERRATDSIDDVIEDTHAGMSSNGGHVPTIVTAGRLAHAKNLPLLVNSLQLLARRMNFRAWVLGRGELEGELRERLASAGLAEQVALLGFQTNPWRFMAKADVFLLTSRYEGFGNVLIEAMGAGLPVVATASHGTRDIVEHDRNGLLVDRHEPDAVADALERVLTDADCQARMSVSASARAQDFRTAAVVDRFEQLLQSL